MSTRHATRGVIYVHSAPSALCPHIEWALGGVLGHAVSLDWTPQPAQAGTYRSEFSWLGESGTGAHGWKTALNSLVVLFPGRLKL